MADEPEPPSPDALRAVLPPDPKRDAIDTEYGFHWQRWLTIIRWISLKSGEALHIEWEEDFTVSRKDAVETAQAKSSPKPITLGTKETQEILGHALTRDETVTTIVWTRGPPGFELGNPLGEEGVIHWRRVASGEIDGAQLKAFLQRAEHLGSKAQRAIAAADGEAFVAMVSRVLWIVDEDDIDELKQRAGSLLEARVEALKLERDTCDSVAMQLFAHIAHEGLIRDPTRRRLTPRGLDQFLKNHHQQWMESLTPGIQHALSRDAQRAFEAGRERLNELERGIFSRFDEIAGKLQTAAPATVDRPSPEPDMTPTFERQLALRFDLVLRKSLFNEFNGQNLFAPLAADALSEAYANVDPTLRRRVLLRASRAAAITDKNVGEAERLLEAAKLLRGDESDRSARARIAEVKGDIKSALALLSDDTGGDARAVVISMFSRAGRDSDALAFVEANGLVPNVMNAAGVHALAYIHLRRGDYGALFKLMSGVREDQIREGPQLLFLRGVARFASLFAPAVQRAISLGMPVGATPVVSDVNLVAERLDRAIDDFERLLAMADELGLTTTATMVERYRRWCELCHPSRRAAAIERLTKDLTSPKTASGALQFAFAFDVPVNEAAMAAALDRRERESGWDEDDLTAALMLELRSEDPKRVLAFIEKRKEALERVFGKSAVAGTEIQAAVASREVARARAIFDAMAENGEGLAGSRTVLEALIVDAEGGDGSKIFQIAYERAPSVATLRPLLDAVMRKGDREAVVKYSRELYSITLNEADLDPAARALAAVGSETPFLELMAEHPGIEERHDDLAIHLIAVLYKQGRLKDAKECAHRFSARKPLQRPLDLELAIAVESGAWENLIELARAHLQAGRSDDGQTLLRAATVAQIMGAGPLWELVEAAINAAPDDPHVLMGANLIVVEEGLEHERPEAQTWFRRAIDLSGKEGPLRQLEIGQLVDLQSEWRERAVEIAERIDNAELPLTIAAKGLQSNVVELVSGHFVRNVALLDPRKRGVLPLYAGHRGPMRLDAHTSAAFDITALLSLGWLGVLPKALALFERVRIPAGAMTELFEGRQRIRKAQRSRIVFAQAVREAVATGRIKIQDKIVKAQTGELDADLEETFVQARAEGGFVVRAAPIHPWGKFEGEVDLSAFSDVLCDTRALLQVLDEAGALTADEEAAARTYLESQDKGWTFSAKPDPAKPLFLDQLALSYLQAARLLPAILDTFRVVWVEPDVGEEIKAVLEEDANANKVLSLIETVRAGVRAAFEEGRAEFSGSSGARSEIKLNASTFNHDFADLGCIIVDDRAINKEAVAHDRNQVRVAVANGLDVLEELKARAVLSDSEWRAALHKLRISGASLIPISAEELSAAALRMRLQEPAELRAIRESIDLPRKAGSIRLPRELYWFAMTSIAIKNAIKLVWTQEADMGRAAKLADVLLVLLPRAEDWLGAWSDGAPGGWTEDSNRTLLAGIAMPVELGDRRVRDAYNEWLEEKLLAPLRKSAPDRYDGVVAQVRDFMLGAEDDDAGEA